MSLPLQRVQMIIQHLLHMLPVLPVTLVETLVCLADNLRVSVELICHAEADVSERALSGLLGPMDGQCHGDLADELAALIEVVDLYDC